MAGPASIEKTSMQRKDILEELKSLAIVFTNASVNLFETTRPPQLLDYEKALYFSTYVKPSKRLSKIFSTDREVLVVFTNFPEQQQRTAGLVKSHLAESEGRLESTLAVVVHSDLDGNLKLKKWGRELGISILPILAKDGALDSNNLERDLLQDFFANDPFDVTGPVYDDSTFYGRRSEAVDIARQLQKGQIKACLGIRKIGKTSILTRIIHEVESSHDCISIVVDCSRDDVWNLSGSELIDSLAYSMEIAVSAASVKTELMPRHSTLDYGPARNLLTEAIVKAEKPVLIFFDEIDYITPGSPTAPEHWLAHFNPFWRSMRAVFQQCVRDRTIVSLLISGVSGRWFKSETVAGVENAALAFVPDDYLSPLSSTASASMVRSIAKTCGISLTEAAAESMGKICGHMPYWTRKAGSYLHRNIDVLGRPIQVSNETVDRLCKEFVDVEGAAIAEVALAHLFRVYPELLSDCLEVKSGKSRTKSSKNIATLIRYGVLVDRQGTIVLGSEMIEAGINRYVVNLDETVDSSTENNFTHKNLHLALDDWADELALINASRNKLEKRLRSIALNFIKFSSLSKPGSASPQLRLMKCVQSNRSKALSSLPVDDLVEKLLWTELVATIEKEWDIFGAIFKDKRVFKSNAEIINERYDAHAKSADLADLALYRKSLRWMEDMLTRIGS